MRCSARTTPPIRSRPSRARMRSSSRSTIAASGTATTTCSVISSERSSSVAIRSCSPCTWSGQQLGASCTEALTRRSPTRTRAAISRRPAGSRSGTGTSSQVAGGSRRCGSGSTAAPTRRSNRTPSCRSRQPGCPCCSAIRSERGGSSPRPSGGRSMWHPPTGRPRFVRHSRLSEVPSLPTESTGCCATPSSSTPRRSTRAPGGFSAPVALWGRRTFSWADRKKRSTCSVRHSLCRATGQSSRTYGSTVSATWPSRPQRSAIGETRRDGRSKRYSWSKKRVSTR